MNEFSGNIVNVVLSLKAVRKRRRETTCGYAFMLASLGRPRIIGRSYVLSLF